MYETNYYPTYKRNTELYHHGVLGMKWGVRRYQPYGEGGYNPKKKKGLYKRLNRAVTNYDDSTTKILSGRSANRDRMESRFDTKIGKANAKGNTNKAAKLQVKKDYKLKDFDIATKAIKKGRAEYRKVLTDYGDMKVAGLELPEARKKKVKGEIAARKYLQFTYGSTRFADLIVSHDLHVVPNARKEMIKNKDVYSGTNYEKRIKKWEKSGRYK